MKARSERRNASAGVALVVVMVVLVIVSVLGIGSVQLSTMTGRGARNDRDTQLAMQSAQASLRDAIVDIDGPPGASTRALVFSSGNRLDFESGCAGTGIRKGLCAQVPTGKPAWLAVDLADASRTAAFGDFTGRSYASASGDEHGLMPAALPRYVVEAIEDKAMFRDLSRPPGVVYRVTGIGFGPRRDIHAVVQMLYRKKKD